MGDGDDPYNNPEALGLIAVLVLLGWLALASTAANIMATTFYGEVFGLGWYYLSFAILWRNINPLTPLYTHSNPVGQVGNLQADLSIGLPPAP
jgi:hypothetical protein